MRDFLCELVKAINEYDDTPETFTLLRDYVCLIMDNPEWEKDPMVKNIVYVASRKLRMFGYINHNDLDTFNSESLKDLAIEERYAGEAYPNNLLDKEQINIIETFENLNRKRLIVSAPTSFGKTYILREIIYRTYLRSPQKYKNIILVFPTVALLLENTSQFNHFISLRELPYNVINSTTKKFDPNGDNIFILTPERTLKLLADYPDLKIDFFFFDEVYKIEEKYQTLQNDMQEVDEEECEKTTYNIDKYILFKDIRDKAFRVALYLLTKKAEDFYLAGPYINLLESKGGFKRYIEKNQITDKPIFTEPTLKIDVDATESYFTESTLLGNTVYNFPKDKKEKLSFIVKNILIEKKGPTLIYCYSPGNINIYLKTIFDIDIPIVKSDYFENKRVQSFLSHLKETYKYEEDGKNIANEWNVVRCLEKGIAIHHGQLPKYIVSEQLQLFNEGHVNILFCTSTLVEGVNTNAKNIIILTSGKATAFDLRNIRGRAGRYYRHYIGRIWYMDKKQIISSGEGMLSLNFTTYDDIPISSVDLDNSNIEDLCGVNVSRKLERNEKSINYNVTSEIFEKNRLVPYDIQEQIFLYIENNFEQYQSLLSDYKDIFLIIKKKQLSNIFSIFVGIGLMTEKQKDYFAKSAFYYSFGGFAKLIEYRISKCNDETNRAYSSVFRTIRDTLEFKVPQLLSIFESLFVAVADKKGVEHNGFTLKYIINYFELGVFSDIGQYLVEKGFPPVSARAFVEKNKDLAKLEEQEAISLIKKHINKYLNSLDNYERILFNEIFC